MILVTGASGNVGRHVVSGMVAQGADVRALTRDPASAPWPEGIEVARGNLSVASSLDPVLDGVDVVFLLWLQASAEHPDAAIDALARHAHRVVYVSSLTVDDDLVEQTHPMTAIHADIGGGSVDPGSRGRSCGRGGSRPTRWRGLPRSGPVTSFAYRTQRPFAHPSIRVTSATSRCGRSSMTAMPARRTS